eukprot:UN07538
MQNMWLITLLLLSKIAYATDCNVTRYDMTQCMDSVSQCKSHQVCSKRVSADDNQWEALRGDEECGFQCKCYCLEIVIITPTLPEIHNATSRNRTINGDDDGEIYLYAP